MVQQLLASLNLPTASDSPADLEVPPGLGHTHAHGHGAAAGFNLNLFGAGAGGNATATGTGASPFSDANLASSL